MTTDDEYGWMNEDVVLACRKEYILAFIQVAPIFKHYCVGKPR